MIVYYRERNGDFLAIDTATRNYCLTAFGRDEYEGRATAIAGLAGSVCTTGVRRAYLAVNCKQVAREAVPAEWLRVSGF